MISPRKAVIRMQEYKPPTSGRENSLRLDFNENTVGCSPKVIKALSRIRKNIFSVYPEYEALKKEIAKYCNISPGEVIATNGTDEAIKTIIEVYSEKRKDEIIIPVPTYAMFKFYAELNEAVIREVLYNEDLSFPTSRLLSAINKKTKIVVLVNPNNPTGTSIKKEEIKKIIEKAGKFGALVLIDEAYYQFYGKSSIQLIKKYDNLFVTQTFSKVLGLAGLRLGYIASNEKNISVVQKALSPYSVNVFAAICSAAALNDKEYIKKYISEIKKGKSMLYRELKNLGIKYCKSDANFVLLRIEKNSSYFCKRLKDEGILVRNRSSDPLLDGCVRVTLGTVKQTRQFICRLKEIIKEINPVLIFDIDGVLVDVSKSYRAAIQKTCEYFANSQVSSKEIQNYKNKGGLNNDWDLTEAIIRAKGVYVKKEKIIRKFQQFYGKLKNKEKWMLKKKILEQLSKKYRLAILTGRPRKEAACVLRKNGATRYFKIIVAMEDVSKQKPNPEGFLKILKNPNRENAFYFGDTIDDMKAAVLANINAVGVLPPQDKSAFLKNILSKNGAIRVLDSINELEGELNENL
ncbi:MAG TPA: histidinol-phosphate transaminase [Candidatus Nanoarchaeia archaeon]|nr:histidinol-phosphate transaminase [Candidatus Nanoarchaeia archaeon]